ncbi:MAG: hypothetical protein LWX11_02635, partial [Firmicutes bacterium]|nr:hypothetical protein [Bacillota bacterium]
SKLVSDGHLDRQGTTSTTTDTTLKQYGLGAGVHAQFWVPFVGLGAELGVIQRYQRYEYEAETARRQETLFRPWLRVGVRYKIPSLHFYVTASYQEPLTRSRPVHLDSTTDLVTYLNAQGSGQEFHRMWTFGAGVWF